MTIYQLAPTGTIGKPITKHGIIFDLDETLVHSFENAYNDLKELQILTNPKFADLRSRVYSFTVEEMGEQRGSGDDIQIWGITRPHLKKFLNFCFSYFSFVAVWSAGMKKYVENITSFIFRDIHPPKVVFSAPDCEKNPDESTLKPIEKMLSRFNIPLSSVFILDDKVYTANRNPDNLINIPEYNPSPTISSLRQDDETLLKLIFWFLQPNVINSNDVRTLDKRYIFLRTLNQYNISFNQSYPHSSSPKHFKPQEKKSSKRR